MPFSRVSVTVCVSEPVVNVCRVFTAVPSSVKTCHDPSDAYMSIEIENVTSCVGALTVKPYVPEAPVVRAMVAITTSFSSVTVPDSPPSP